VVPHIAINLVFVLDNTQNLSITNFVSILTGQEV